MEGGGGGFFVERKVNILEERKTLFRLPEMLAVLNVLGILAIYNNVLLGNVDISRHLPVLLSLSYSSCLHHGLQGYLTLYA